MKSVAELFETNVFSLKIEDIKPKLSLAINNFQSYIYIKHYLC